MMIDYKYSKGNDNAFSGFSLNIEKADMNNQFILDVKIYVFYFFIWKNEINNYQKNKGKK